jgi:hypothetical protein
MTGFWKKSIKSGSGIRARKSRNELSTGYGYLLGSSEAAGGVDAPLYAAFRQPVHFDHCPGRALPWAYHRLNPDPVIQRIDNDLLPDVTVLEFDTDCAKQFGRVWGQLLQRGVSVSRVDLMIAAVALVHNLTLVTHNTADYQNIPGLRLDDWLTP